jgi:hypothetical protein
MEPYLAFEVSLFKGKSVVVVNDVGDFSLESCEFGRSVVDDFIDALIVETKVVDVRVEEIELLLQAVDVGLQAVDGLKVGVVSGLEFSFVEELEDKTKFWDFTFSSCKRLYLCSRLLSLL